MCLFYVRLRTCAQYASMNEFTCSEHSVRIHTLKNASLENSLKTTHSCGKSFVQQIHVFKGISWKDCFIMKRKNPTLNKLCCTTVSFENTLISIKTGCTFRIVLSFSPDGDFVVENVWSLFLTQNV